MTTKTSRTSPKKPPPPSIGREGVYERLKVEILENRFPPGSHAAEPELAQQLGVSRTPVREALIRLQGEGLVELIPRRGARVLPVSPEDMREIYEVLTALEPEAAAKLAQRRHNGKAADAELAPLEAATSTMEQALAQEDLITWAVADDTFHRTLLQLGDNRRLERIVGGLFDQAHRARMITLWMRQLPVSSTQEHRAILEAISAGEAETARRLFRCHRERAASELIALLERSKLKTL